MFYTLSIQSETNVENEAFVLINVVKTGDHVHLDKKIHLSGLSYKFIL